MLPRSGATLGAAAVATLAVVIGPGATQAWGAGTPTNTSLPTISGTPATGQTLTADPGTWSGTQPITYAYKWQRCDSSGNNCATEPNNATSQTYTPIEGDVGKTIRVKVTAKNSVGSTTATSAQTAVVQSVAYAPVNLSPPKISGTAEDGQTLTVTKGSWSGTGTLSYSYQWQRCGGVMGCLSILGATGKSYTAQPEDVGSTLRVVETSTNKVGSTSQASAETAIVQATPPVNTAPPTISGTAQDGQTLTADPGTWKGTPPISQSYQWQRCDSGGGACADIANATSNTYKAVSDDVDSTLRVVVKGSNAGGSATANSNPTATVKPLEPSNTTKPTISGTARVDQELTADPGTWTGTTPLTYTYQWRRCDAGSDTCTDIAGATDQKYTVTRDDKDSKLRVEVTATNKAGSATESSDATDVVGVDAPLNTSPPTITGSAHVKSTLTADPGSWKGSDPIDYAYQWRRCDSNGDNCVDIDGATESTYDPVDDDVDSTIRVAVTASNDGGSGVESSAATDVVVAEPKPPENDTLPSISGNTLEGETLTVDPGTWKGTQPISYKYQWRRCDDDGDCARVDGATGQTYTLSPEDSGLSMSVDVTATNDAGSTVQSAPQTKVVEALSPVNTDAPTISGSPQKGQTLTADKGNWSGTGTISYDYRWRRCDTTGATCVDIGGATGQTYALTIDDVGSTIRLAVTASNRVGTETAVSAGTTNVTGVYRQEVMNDAPSAYWRLGEPSGTVAADQTSGNDTGTFQNGITLGWVGAVAGDPDTAPSFDGVDDQVNMGNPANLNFDKSSFAAEVWLKTTDHKEEAVVAKQPAVTQTAWELTVTDDTGFVGYLRAKITDNNNKTVKAYSPTRVDDGKWHHMVALFDRANGITVYEDGLSRFTAGAATGSVNNKTNLLIGQEGRIYPYFKGQIDEVALYNHLLTPDRVKAHYENGVAKATPPPANTAVPAVSGTAKNGYLLSAAPGTWSGTPPISYAYQWRRCNTTGANCYDIAGATQPSYSLTAQDVGSTVQVAVTAANAGGKTVASSILTGVVADGAADPVVGAAGDISCHSAAVFSGLRCHYSVTSNLIANDSRISDVLALGDNQYDCADYDFFNSYFDPTWGRFKGKTHPSAGNHEYYTYAPPNPDGTQDPGTRTTCDHATTVPAQGYFDYFNGTGQQNGPAGNRDKGYYSFDIGNWHVIALNSECDRIGGCDEGSPQEQWLQSDLAAHSAKCTLAYWHVPRFSSGHIGNEPTLRPLWQDLQDAGADLVLNGHDHDYERFAPQNPDANSSSSGIREFVVGTGGASHGTLGTLQPNSEVRNFDTFGVLKLTLHNDSYDWQFVPETPDGFSDSGSAVCH